MRGVGGWGMGVGCQVSGVGVRGWGMGVRGQVLRVSKSRRLIEVKKMVR
jgi:hypothetical protein